MTLLKDCLELCENDLQIYSEKLELKNLKCFIATDGVSDDIIDDKKEEFLDTIIAKLKDIRFFIKKRNSLIEDILKNWHTKYHSDDKTVTILWGK